MYQDPKHDSAESDRESESEDEDEARADSDGNEIYNGREDVIGDAGVDGVEPEAAESEESITKATFTIPLQYLVCVSPYFENLFTSGYTQDRSATKETTLDDVEIITFEVFYEWPHSKSLVTHAARRFKDFTKVELEDFDVFEDHCGQLLDLYLFADKCNVPRLRKDSLETFTQLCRNTVDIIPFRLVASAYAVSPNTSPFICFIIDLTAACFDGSLAT